ncbi:MAG: hypothetical protein ACLFNV_11925 [Desulfovibrionales bacterium]
MTKKEGGITRHGDAGFCGLPGKVEPGSVYGEATPGQVNRALPRVSTPYSTL